MMKIMPIGMAGLLHDYSLSERTCGVYSHQRRGGNRAAVVLESQASGDSAPAKQLPRGKKS